MPPVLPGQPVDQVHQTVFEPTDVEAMDDVENERPRVVVHLRATSESAASRAPPMSFMNCCRTGTALSIP